MIRLPHFLAALFVAASAMTAYPQEELPVEVLGKLNEKALQLHPDDLRAQEKYVADNTTAYAYMQMIPVPKGNEAAFAALKKRADEKFPMDFVKQNEFVLSMIEGITLIDAYDFAFADKNEFKKLKAAVLDANPDDYKKAAADFEKQAQAVLELNTIPKPESLDQDTWDAIKLGLSVKYKGNFPKQKETLNQLFERMNALFTFEEMEKANSQIVDMGPSQYEREELLKKDLGDSVLMVQNDKALGFVTTIQNRDVVIFPSDAYDARGMSVTNKLDERVIYDEVFASKDVPVSIAFVKSIPQGVKRVKLADEAVIKANVNKDSLMYSFEMRSDALSRNKISAMGSVYLNMANRLMRSIIPGAIIVDDSGENIMGMVVEQARLADIGNLTSQEEARYLVRQLKKENLNKVVVRLDKLQNWERIDPQVYLQQSEVVENLRKRNEQFMTLFTTTRFSALEDVDVYRGTYERFYAESRNKYERTAQERMVRDMITEILGNMRRDILKADPSKFYGPLQEPYEFNLKIRQKMMETLETAVKNKTHMNYYFDDMKPKGK